MHARLPRASLNGDHDIIALAHVARDHIPLTWKKHPNQECGMGIVGHDNGIKMYGSSS